MSSLTVESFPEGSEELKELTDHLQNPDIFNIEQFPTLN